MASAAPNQEEEEAAAAVVEASHHQSKARFWTVIAGITGILMLALGCITAFILKITLVMLG